MSDVVEAVELPFTPFVPSVGGAAEAPPDTPLSPPPPTSTISRRSAPPVVPPAAAPPPNDASPATPAVNGPSPFCPPPLPLAGFVPNDAAAGDRDASAAAVVVPVVAPPPVTAAAAPPAAEVAAGREDPFLAAAVVACVDTGAPDGFSLFAEDEAAAPGRALASAGDGEDMQDPMV